MSKKALQIYSFEPLPSIYKKMNKNIALNKIKNIKTYNLAISNKDGNIKMTKTDNSVASRLDLNGNINVKSISWNTLNKITPKKIDLLKIDIEGGEYLLIKQPKILDKVDQIIIELHINDHKDKENCIKLITIFKNKNFIVPTKIYTDIKKYTSGLKLIEGIFDKKN
jgi:FkbM family methyltransferase